LAAGVLDAAGLRDAVGGLVQQRAQHLQGATLEAFAADQDLVAVAAVDLPAVRGEVAEVEPLTLRPGGDHRVRHVGVVLTDGLPGPFRGGDQQAGRPVRAGAVVGFVLYQGFPSWCAGRVLA
jgi:hypothetical protein